MLEYHGSDLKEFCESSSNESLNFQRKRVSPHEPEGEPGAATPQ
jgi:hypothetical protein